MMSLLNMLHSFINSLKVDLLPTYFLTRSKKAMSSATESALDVGANGSGIAGVSVGDTAGPFSKGLE